MLKQQQQNTTKQAHNLEGKQLHKIQHQKIKHTSNWLVII